MRVKVTTITPGIAVCGFGSVVIITGIAEELLIRLVDIVTTLGPDEGLAAPELGVNVTI